MLKKEMTEAVSTAMRIRDRGDVRHGRAISEDERREDVEGGLRAHAQGRAQNDLPGLPPDDLASRGMLQPVPCGQAPEGGRLQDGAICSSSCCMSDRTQSPNWPN